MLIIPLFYLFIKQISTLYNARLSVLLLSLSPFFLLMGSEYMNHPSSLLFLLLSLILIVKNPVDNSIFRCNFLPVFSGFFWGVAFIIRPLTGLAFGCVILYYLIRKSKNNLKKIPFSMFLFVLGCLPLIGFYLLFNSYTTGYPFVTGYQLFFDANPLGFGYKPWGDNPLGPEIPKGEFHTPLRGIANIVSSLNGLNLYLFGWPIPSLFFAILLWCPGFTRKQEDWDCLFVISSVFIVYFFYFYQDFCFGPRFYYETIPFWILLSARGIEEFLKYSQSLKNSIGLKFRTILYSCLISLFVIAAGTTWIERIYEYGDSYWGTQKHIPQLVMNSRIEQDAIIFIENGDDYISVFSFLDPFFESGWIVAHDLGVEKNRKLIQEYPEWPVYFLRLIDTGDSDTLQSVLVPYEN
jgi:4-amino-4-deoxy-L-arabinose transferase-like glycosyltransferase